MTTSTIKADLCQLIEQTEDTILLQKVYEILKLRDTVETIVGYKPDGTPLTAKDCEQQIVMAQSQVKSGQVISMEDLEKEVEKW